MRKLFVLLFMLPVFLIFSGCFTNHDKMTYYAASQFDYITLDTLMEYGGDFELGHYMTFGKTMDTKWKMEGRFDRKRGEEDQELCRQAIDELLDILSEQKLYALKITPEYNGDYDKFASEYFSDPANSAHYASLPYPRFHASIPALHKKGAPKDQTFLRWISIIGNPEKCQIDITFMRQDDDKKQQEYIYYIEDTQLIQKLSDWVDRCLERDGAEPYEYEEY